MAGKISGNDIRCSFCNKTQGQVRKLIAGPAGVYICDECVDICADILEEELEEALDEEQAKKKAAASDEDAAPAEEKKDNKKKAGLLMGVVMVIGTVLGVALLVISLLVSNRFPEMEPSLMLDKAVLCILWQIGITAVLSLMINLIVALRYDRNGDLRSEKSGNK